MARVHLHPNDVSTSFLDGSRCSHYKMILIALHRPRQVIVHRRLCALACGVEGGEALHMASISTDLEVAARFTLGRAVVVGSHITRDHLHARECS